MPEAVSTDEVALRPDLRAKVERVQASDAPGDRELRGLMFFFDVVWGVVAQGPE